MILESEHLNIIELMHLREMPWGRTRCVLVNAWAIDDPAPCMLTVTMLLGEIVDDKWGLLHIIVEPDERRRGIATELVRFYEERLGRLDVAWVSSEGEAFGRKYIERFGPREHWQIGSKLIAGVPR